jgi:SnoaL-like domain
MPLAAEDELSILRLLSRYAHVASRRDIPSYPDDWTAMWTEDGVWERALPTEGGKYDEAVRIEGLAAQREFAVGAIEEWDNSQYFSANAVITGDGDQASGYTSIFIAKINGIDGSIYVIGNCQDRYRKVNGEWKFSYRGVHLIS